MHAILHGPWLKVILQDREMKQNKGYPIIFYIKGQILGKKREIKKNKESKNGSKKKRRKIAATMTACYLSSKCVFIVTHVEQHVLLCKSRHVFLLAN